MATQYKTRCPHCAAQFKITEEHLKQANGAVRCGSCLQIFQATDHLVDPPAADNNAPLDRWAGALDSNASTPPPQKSKPLFEKEPEPDADNLSMEGMELSDSFMSLDEGSSDDGLGEDFSDMAGAGRSTHNEGADESWAEALLNELDDDDTPDTQAPTAPPRATFAPRDEQQSSQQPATEPLRSSESRKPARPARNEPESDTLFGGLDLFGDDLNDEPVPIPSKPVRERDIAFKARYDWQGLVKWTLLSAFAALLLVGQYAWFNFDNLARSPQWRPVYLQACEALGCKLPNRSDISKLRGANLVVRSHPEYSNALIVDAILFNEARYPQPFPDLELRFSALDGNPVASRRFKPQEYLQGDLKGMDSMPTNTPLHVSLEIVDPGDRAVNYNLRLLTSLNSTNQVSQR